MLCIHRHQRLAVKEQKCIALPCSHQKVAGSNPALGAISDIMNSEKSMPKVGAGVLILRKKQDTSTQLLMAKRKSPLGNGTWGTGGGHLEFGESPEQCVKREIKEEFGIEIKNIKFLCVCNIVKYEKHYVDIGFTAETDGNPQIMEPEKFSAIEWFDMDNLPNPMFEAVRLYLISYKTGKLYHS